MIRIFQNLITIEVDEFIAISSWKGNVAHIHIENLKKKIFGKNIEFSACGFAQNLSISSLIDNNN